jgi:hypothetical protein
LRVPLELRRWGVVLELLGTPATLEVRRVPADSHGVARSSLLLARLEFSWQEPGGSWPGRLPTWLVVPTLVAVALDLVAAFEPVSRWAPAWLVPQLGGVPISPAAPLGVLVFAVVVNRGRRQVGGGLFLVVLAVVVGAGLATWLVATEDDWAGLVALVAGVASEVAIYGITLPWVVAVGFRRWGAKGVWAGMAVSSLVFMLLPGHTAQYSLASAGPLAFAAFGLLSCVVAWEVQSPVPIFLAHLAIDLLGMAARVAPSLHLLAALGAPGALLAAGGVLVASLWGRLRAPAAR